MSEEVKNLEELTVSELQKIAKAEGIAITRKTKPMLIELIKSAKEVKNEVQKQNNEEVGKESGKEANEENENGKEKEDIKLEEVVRDAKETRVFCYKEHIRTYSEERHGKDYEKLAEGFVEKKNKQEPGAWSIK